jgi:hypothetical protein
MLDGGPAQRAFGHRAGGHRFVEARLRLLGAASRSAQVPGGAGVLAPRGRDRPRRRQRRPGLGERSQPVGQPGSAAIFASSAAILASHSAIRAARRRARAVAPMYSACSYGAVRR